MQKNTNENREDISVVMANGLLQLRVDNELKQKASDVYSQLGIDLPSAIRIFLTRSVQVNGFPFVMRLSDKPLQPDETHE